MSENKTNTQTEEELEQKSQEELDREEDLKFLETATPKEMAQRIVNLMDVVQGLSTLVMTNLVTSTSLLQMLVDSKIIDAEEYKKVSEAIAVDVQKGLVASFENLPQQEDSQ